MNERSSQPPPGWGNDSLTQYLENCRANQWATFANKRSEVIDISTIDGMFRKLLVGAVNPKPLLPAGFLFRSHSAYLSACGAVMAGQLHEAWALLRVCLEQGGYAHYIGDDAQRWERWMSRHDACNRTQQDKWKKEFAHGRVLHNIKTADAALWGAYKKLYEWTIDYGAHPNERGASMGTILEEMDDGRRRFNTVYLHDNGCYLDFLLRATAQVGICVLRIAQVIYPTRSQATGVQFELEIIARRF